MRYLVFRSTIARLIPVVFFAFAACRFAVADGEGPGLDRAWQTLSEATTDPYFRGLTHSTKVRAEAIRKLWKIRQDGNKNQRTVAEAALRNWAILIEIQQAMNRVGIGRRAQRVIVDEFIRDALFDPDHADMKFINVFVEQGKRISQHARLEHEWQKQRVELQTLWHDSVLPAVERHSGTLSGKPLLELKAGTLDSSVWLLARNISGRTIRNCSFEVRIRDGDTELPPRAYFVREWPSGETVRPEPFRGYRINIVRPIPGADIRDFANQNKRPAEQFHVTYSVWCDSGRTPDRKAKIVAGSELGEPVLQSILHAGATFIHEENGEKSIFRLKSVNFQKGGAQITATVEQAKTGAYGKGKVQTEVSHYSGFWIRQSESPEGLDLPLTRVGPANNNRQGASPARKKDSNRSKASKARGPDTRPRGLIDMQEHIRGENPGLVGAQLGGFSAGGFGSDPGPDAPELDGSLSGPGEPELGGLTRPAGNIAGRIRGSSAAFEWSDGFFFLTTGEARDLRMEPVEDRARK